MYKIIVMFFVAIVMFSCSKKDSGPNNGFVDILPLIAGKWKATRYEEKTTTGPWGSQHDTLIINNNINNKGVPFISYDSVDMIDFISRDSFGIKEADPNLWRIYSSNDINDGYYIDWYRNQIIHSNGGPYSPIFNIILNNNSLQIRWDDSRYYTSTYFERPK